MSFEAWTIFALFWVVFVVTPGPNHLNCIQTGMAHGLRRGLWAVAAILTQAVLFLTLSAAGITALIAASPMAFDAARLLGAAVLIWLGLRGWVMARRPGRSAGLGRAALGAVFNIWLRRALASCFILYGVLLGSAATAAGRV